MATPDRATLQAAAEWYAWLREAEPGSALHADHRAWLEQDPGHLRAWARIEKLNRQFDGAPRTLLRSILERARAARRRAVLLLMILVMTGAGVAGGSWQAGLHHQLMADHATGTGERRQVRLADGSVIDLNTGTALDVHFDGRRRRIHLHHGEIQVTIASDEKARPFIVTTDQGRIRALGTRFLVRGEGDYSRVSVLEHAVEICPATAPKQPTRVWAGYQARFTEQETGPVERLAGRPAAWTRGQLIVSDWPLGRFLDELSRHHQGVLGYDDAVADFRISGAFHLDNTGAILDNLAGTLPVRVRRLTPYWVRVEPRDP